MSSDFIFRRRNQTRGDSPKSEVPQREESSRSARGVPLFLRKEIDITQPGDACEEEAEKFAAAGGNLGAATPAVTPRRTPESVAEFPDDHGHPLSPEVRSQAKAILGGDLDVVRVHDSSTSRTAATQLGARAFTVGSDIWLGSGAHEQDRDLMSHELLHVRQQAQSGKPSLMRQTIASALPPSVDVKSASLSFSLPGNRALSEELSTVNSTQVNLSISPAGLRVNFSPPLLINTPFYASNMEWSSLTYDFAKGAVTGIGLADTSILPSGQDQARTALTGKVTSLLAGTRVAAGSYDPVNDPDIMGTLGQIKSNFAGMGSGGSGGAGGITAADIDDIAATVNLVIGTPIHQGTPQGAINISGAVSLTARLRGNAGSLSQGGPVVESVHVSGDSIMVQKDGEDVAQIHDASMANGGSVTIGRMTLLGAAKTAGGVESTVKLFALLAELGQGSPEDRLAVSNAQPNLEAEIVPGLTRHTIQDALTQALRELIRHYATAIPGYDLNTIFGVPQLGDFPLTVPGEGPGSRMG